MVRLRLYPLTVPRLVEPMACARVMGIDQALALRCLRPDMAFCGVLLRAAALIDEPLRALRGPGARMIARGGVVEARRVAPEIPVLPTRKACRGVAAALTLLAPVVRLGRGGACPHVIGTLDAMARVIDRVASDRPLPGGDAVEIGRASCRDRVCQYV